MLSTLLRAEFFRGESFGFGERMGGGDFDIGLVAAAFPVGVGDGIDGASEGNANPKMIVDAVAVNGMSAAAGGLADNGGAFQSLQVVGELFATGKGFFRGQNESWLADEAGAWNVRQSPILVGGIVLAGPKIVEVRALCEEVG